MVAIIEGRDPELVENPYASTVARDAAIEAPAKKVHMISEKIEMPALEEAAEAAPTEVPAAETAPEAPVEEAPKDEPQA
jgi:cell division protease FtsH